MTKTPSVNSCISHINIERCVPQFRSDEIELGDMIGSGDFCTVYGIQTIQTSNDHDSMSDKALSEKTSPLGVKNFFRKNIKHAPYVVKCLSDETKEDLKRFAVGAADLAMEARLLASLNHPNITKLRGVSASGQFGIEQEMGDFLVLDRLETTLDKRVIEWRSFSHKSLLRRKSPFSLNKQRRTFLAKRLRVALDVASALQHIHQHDIVYLDLKPENVGFDAYDNVQLFYFGSAKQLDYGSNAKEFNEMSGNKGVQPLTPEVALGLPYNQKADVYSFGMAPEVALGLPYNQNADVYSFGLLLWQIVALAMPFGEIVCE